MLSRSFARIRCSMSGQTLNLLKFGIASLCHSEKFPLEGGGERNEKKGLIEDRARFAMFFTASRHNDPIPTSARLELTSSTHLPCYFRKFYYSWLLLGRDDVPILSMKSPANRGLRRGRAKLQQPAASTCRIASTYRRLGNIPIALDTVACVPIRAASSAMM